MIRIKSWGILFSLAISILTPVTKIQAQELGGFYNQANVPIAPFNMNRAFEASVRFRDCSSAIISNSGYVLTALHCLAKCTSSDEISSEGIHSLEHKNYKMLEIDSDRREHLVCPDKVMESYYMFEFDAWPKSVTLTGTGRTTNDERTVQDIPESAFETLVATTDDFAILKFETIDPKKKLPCIPVAKSRPAPNDRIWAIGFPTWNYRPGTRAANGAEEVISTGRIRDSVSDDPILQQYFGDSSSSVAALQWLREEELWDQPRFLRTSVDAMGGNSGGMMVDRNGELAAILFTTIKQDQEQYNGSTVIGVDIHHIQDSVEKALGKEKAAEVFDCQSI